MNARTRCLITASGALLLLCAQQASAHAGAWSSPVGGGATILGYGEQYAGRTHRGVDISAASASEVCSPATGVVIFAGNVPADGGGVCGAVTVELPDGLKVSLLPLEEVFVSAGQPVGSGEAVGLLAAAGDDSSAASHLHLGLRRGDAYLDPSGYLPACSGQAEGTGADVVSDAPPVMATPATSNCVAEGAIGTSAAPSAAGVGVCVVAPAVSVGESLAVAQGAAAVSAATTVKSRAMSGDPVFTSAELPVASTLDSHQHRTRVRGTGGLTLAPAAPPLGVGIVALAALGVGCVLTPWRAVLSRSN